MLGGINALLLKLGLDSASFDTNLTRAQNKVQRFSNSTQRYLKNIDSAMDNLNKSSRLTNVLLSMEAVKNVGAGFINYADGYTEISNKMRLVESESISATRGIQSVFDISMKTNQSVQATSDVYQRFAQNAKTLGISQAQIASLTETVSKAVSISGASASAAQAALMQFGQALASGVLRGQEFNSVVEQTPGLAQAIARGLGVTTGELRKMANEGKLTMDVLIPALEKAKASVDSQYNTRIKTLSGSFENLKTATTQWLGETDKALGVSKLFAEGINTVANNMGVLVPLALSLSTAFAGIKFGQKAQSAYLSASATMQEAKATVIATAAEKEKITTELQATQAYIKSLQAQLNLTQAKGARLALGKELEAQTLRETALINAQSAAVNRLATAKKSASFFSGALGLLGGPLGAVTLGLTAGAAALYSWYESTERAKQESVDFARELDVTTEALKKMSQTEMLVNRDKLISSLETQTEKVSGLRAEYEKLKKAAETPVITTYDSFSGTAITYTKSLKELNQEQVEARAKALELEQAEKELANTREKLGIVSDEVYNVEARLNAELQHTGVVITGTDPLLNQLSQSLDSAGLTALNAVPQFLAVANAMAGIGNAAIVAADQVGALKNQIGADAQALIDRSNRQIAIAKAKSPQEKARLRADDYVKGLKGEFTEAELQAIATAKENEYLTQYSNKGGSKAKKSGGAKTDYVKQYTDQLTEMQSRLSQLRADAQDIALFGQPSQYQEVNKLTQDIATNAEKYKNFGVEGVAKLKEMAAQIDSATQQVAITQFAFDNTEKLKAMEFELTLLGKTRQEQELIQYNHQLDLEAARLKIGMTQENIAKLDQEIAKLKERRAEIQKQTEAHRDNPMAGILDGMRRFGEDATDIFGQVSDITYEAFNGMSDALTDFVMTGKADFRGFAQSVIRSITEMIIKMMLFNAIKSAATAMGYAGGGAVGGSSGASEFFARGGLVGFDVGGYTGPGNRLTPAGIVHRGEYVLTKEATSRLGIDYLDYLNYSTTRGFAAGGGVAVPKVPATPMLGNSGQQNNEVNITIHIDQNGNTETDSKQTAEQAKQLSQLIQVQVLDVLAKQKRVGGMLA